MQVHRLIGAALVLLVCVGCSTTPALPLSDSAEPALSSWEAFEQLTADVAATTNVEKQQRLVDAFLAAHPVSPLVKGNEALFLANRPGDTRILLTGDMTNWFDTLPMERLGQTSLWSIKQQFPPNARLDYRFGVSGAGRGGIFSDPRNPYTSVSGFGMNSELRMPEYVPATEAISRTGVPAGTLDELGLYTSKATSTTHNLVVYLPPGYTPSQRYPTVYFQDGDDYLKYAATPTIFDNGIADGKLPPLIGVFVFPSREQGRQRDYDLNDRYVEFFASELVPMIDQKYSTITDPASRVVVGDSYGGLISLYIGLQYPDLFGAVINQSGFVSRSRNRLITLFAANPGLPLRIHTVVGTYETCIGGPVTGKECNFLEGNRSLKQVLEAGGYELNYSEYPQGHSWGFWQAFIDDGVGWALSKK